MEVERLELLKEKSRSQELVAINEQLSRNAINTPFAGTIQQLLLRNESQVVEKGDVVATLAVDNMPLRVEPHIPSKDRLT